MGTAPPTGRIPTATTVVAIHQPNFFPWLGYFDKIARADVFVVLDSVQYPKKNQGTWMNRVQILVQGAPHWLTVPVDRTFHGLRTVREMRIAPDPRWRERVLDTLRHSYGRSPHFGDVAPFVDRLVRNPVDSIAEYNVASLAALVERLVPRPARMVRSSELPVDGSATDLLVAITRAVGGTTYLCGGGAGGYQDDARFAAAGVELRYQDFAPRPYPQPGAREFVPGLSVLDALFNLGVEGTAALIAGCA